MPASAASRRHTNCSWCLVKPVKSCVWRSRSDAFLFPCARSGTLAFSRLMHGVELRPLFRRQHPLHPEHHQCVLFVQLRTSSLDALHLIHHGTVVTTFEQTLEL